MLHKFVAAVAVTIALCCCLPAQENTSSVKQVVGAAWTVNFTLDRPALEPHHYLVSVDSLGRGSYSIAAEPTNDSVASGIHPDASDAPPEIVKFNWDMATVRHILELARQANYFHGEFDYRKHPVADTGRKTLAYNDSTHAGQTSYNWSENPAITELTKIFTGVAATLDFAPRLQYLLAHDKLGLDQELGNMETVASYGELAELQIVAPLLQQIASDPSVMNIARERARRLLQHAGLPLSASSQP